jgi:outer membrane protein TolC
MDNKLKILAFFFLLNSALQAQTVKKLTLDEAVNRGLQNSYQIKFSAAKTAAMQARLAQIKNQLLPSVNVSTNYTRISDNIEPYKLVFGSIEKVLNPQILNQSYNRLGVQYGIFTGFRAINTLKSNEFLLKATELDGEKDKAEVKLNLINAYYNFYKLIVSKQVLDDNLKTLNSRLTDTKNFVANGIALQNDVLKLELTQANLQQNLADVQSAKEIANFNLNLMLGFPTETQLEIDETTLGTQKNITNPATLIEEAIKNRSELKSADYRKLATERAIEISRGNYYPIVSIGANYDYNLPNQRVFPSQDAFKGTWTAGITASYNLVNLHSTKALIQEQEANLEQCGMLTLQLLDAIKMEVNANVSSYQTALQKIALSEKSIIQATENQRLMKTRYRNQVATLTELLEADTLFTQAQLNIVQAKVDAELAYAKLQKAVGKQL